MEELIADIKNQIASFEGTGKDAIEDFRLKFISRKGAINDVLDQFKQLPGEEKRKFGQEINTLKNLAQDRFKALVEAGESSSDGGSVKGIDLTLPPIPNTLGSIHPLTQVQNEIEDIFKRIGFNISTGPQIEDDWHNFTALNFPPNHPAREMQDTFFIAKDPDIALRTHTSSVQIRVMENQEPPIRTLSPGRVFRNEAISARAHCVFHQVEGLYVNENVGFKDLKETLYYFAKEMFGKDVKIRFRPSYFPFTEPSAEIDISCQVCKGKGCNICKYTTWVEIGGSGMVDPNVLENCGIDSKKYTGFAFGMGIERITMLKYRIDDLRLFTENDIRFLRQFTATSH